MSNVQVDLEGRATVTLSPSNHLASGGEASVYKIGDNIVKVYTDEEKMSRDGMVDKVNLLKPLKTETIIAPEGVVTNKKTGKPIGFFMGFVKGEPLPRVFTTAFWQRTPFSIDQANALVERMRETMSQAHAGGAVMVDANELNWLVSLEKSPVPRVIDVDSWAVGKWQAQVIMPSVRDWHTKGFTTKSDWFSWAVVTFQIYTGTHPYRCTLNGYKTNEWERRMKDNASVFSPGIRVPAAVRSFDTIPAALRGWYEAVFQRGERTTPPSVFAKTAVAQPSAVVHRVSTNATGALVFERLFDEHPVRRVWSCGCVLVDSSGALEVWSVANKRKLFAVPAGADCEVVRAADGWILATSFGDSPQFFHTSLTGGPVVHLDLSIKGTLFRYEDRLFVATADALVELGYIKAAKPILSVARSISVLHPQATQWFDGVGVERAFTSTFVVTPMRADACATTRVPELDGKHVIAGKAGKRFAAFVVEDKNGDLQRIELTFDEDHTSYKTWLGGTDSPDLNMATLPKGVCATIVRDGELTIFVPSSGKTVPVVDRLIKTDLELGNVGDTVVYLDRGALWSVKMR